MRPDARGKPNRSIFSRVSDCVKSLYCAMYKASGHSAQEAVRCHDVSMPLGLGFFVLPSRLLLMAERGSCSHKERECGPSASFAGLGVVCDMWPIVVLIRQVLDLFDRAATLSIAICMVLLGLRIENFEGLTGTTIDLGPLYGAAFQCMRHLCNLSFSNVSTTKCHALNASKHAIPPIYTLQLVHTSIT